MPNHSDTKNEMNIDDLQLIIAEAWKIITPFWPLKNFIATNPLQGLENASFEDAIEKSLQYFQQENIPETMHRVNKETIKWCQAFFDAGQATIMMPHRYQGLYASFKILVGHDERIHENNKDKLNFISSLPITAEEAITLCLNKLNIPNVDRLLFLTLLLTTLPGWSSYVKYYNEWSECDDDCRYPASLADYLAVRTITTYLLWPHAVELISWHYNHIPHLNADKISGIFASEKRYHLPLLDNISTHAARINTHEADIPDAQFVFCIDVRSEPYRKILENQGHYETFGFAGFFGLPIKINNSLLKEEFASCPVLIKPQHTVDVIPDCSESKLERLSRNLHLKNKLKKIYDNLKYTFTTPFTLVEAIGVVSGIRMAFNTLMPRSISLIKRKLNDYLLPIDKTKTVIEQTGNYSIEFSDQCNYALNTLKMIGLTSNFSRFVFLCGHGSSTENNTYASALDCGACGGHQGASNAKVMAQILNNNEVRQYLTHQGINIPTQTVFIAAQHNTTTDDLKIYISGENSHLVNSPEFILIKNNLENARLISADIRLQKLSHSNSKLANLINHDPINDRSVDWAQTRPEWGLARNGAFIVGPRSLTEKINLDGRAFLHSYDWKIDHNGEILTTILTAPMVVAQWINSQYLFSTLDNISYGSGSKVTQNITGKFGVMQGNASDLMCGLPLQSVFSTDEKAYHEPIRLMTIVYAPQHLINMVINQQPVLQKLFGNGWVSLACVDPESNDLSILTRDFSWKSHSTQATPVEGVT